MGCRFSLWPLYVLHLAVLGALGYVILQNKENIRYGKLG